MEQTARGPCSCLFSHLLLLLPQHTTTASLPPTYWLPIVLTAPPPPKKSASAANCPHIFQFPLHTLKDCDQRWHWAAEEVKGVCQEAVALAGKRDGQGTTILCPWELPSLFGSFSLLKQLTDSCII